jgi:hypothetical protein
MLGLESRIFKTPKEAVESGVMDDIIDYDEVYEKLDANREESMKWLRNAILGGSD